MTALVVHGKKVLNGTLGVSGNKNAALPLMCASLLTDDPVRLSNFPPISDGRKIATFFRELGSEVAMDEGAHSVVIAAWPARLWCR